MTQPDRPLAGATVLGAIAGLMLAALGGAKLRPEHPAPAPGDVQPPPSWTLDLFGIPIASGIESYAGTIGLTMLAFTVVGAALGAALTLLVKRWRTRPG